MSFKVRWMTEYAVSPELHDLGELLRPCTGKSSLGDSSVNHGREQKLSAAILKAVIAQTITVQQNHLAFTSLPPSLSLSLFILFLLLLLQAMLTPEKVSGSNGPRPARIRSEFCSRSVCTARPGWCVHKSQMTLSSCFINTL